jgi:hypothetical protein
MVWAEDPETGERALKRVVRTFRNEKGERIHVQVNGETITCTTGHPFYVQGKGRVAAKKLKLNDKLELQNGEDAFVDAIRREKLDQPIQVFNFEVEDFHTYFVGAGCVLVHNLCDFSGEISGYDRLRKAYKGSGKEVHHIIEKRFARTLGVNPKTMPSIALSKADHRYYTNLWKRALPYGRSYTKEQIMSAAFQIYGNNNRVTQAAMQTIFR